ncbi:energy-coupling factor ABC transporter substrate-binding protein [Mariniluteicoccus flavus]
MAEPLVAPRRRASRLVTAALLVAVVALFALPLYFARPADPTGEAFGGTDAQATEIIERDHPAYERWFEPLFEPGSGEVESGLFALQAAIGAGALGYVGGRLHARALRDRARDGEV